MEGFYIYIHISMSIFYFSIFYFSIFSFGRGVGLV